MKKLVKTIPKEAEYYFRVAMDAENKESPVKVLEYFDRAINSDPGYVPASLEKFLCGVACGIGLTILSLYTQKPGCVVDAIDAIAKLGRARRAKEKEENVEREKLRAIGFSDQEIDEVFKP